MLRQKLLILLAGTMLAVVPGSAAASATTCASPTASALNQYCENIPAASGGHAPGPGTPSVATALAPKVAREIARTGLSAERKLLTLPAAGRRHPLPQGSGVGQTTGSSPWLLLLLVLAAITVALTAATVQRRRHRVRVAAEIPG